MVRLFATATLLVAGLGLPLAHVAASPAPMPGGSDGVVERRAEVELGLDGASSLKPRFFTAAAQFFGEFALGFALDKWLGPKPDPALTVADLDEFGEHLLGEISTIVRDAIAEFAQERDQRTVNAFIKNVADFARVSTDTDKAGMQVDDSNLFNLMTKANELMEWLQMEDFSAFATPYYILVATAKLQLWYERIRIARALAFLPNTVNNTDSHIGDMIDHATDVVSDLKNVFLPKARNDMRKKVLVMVPKEISRSTFMDTLCVVNCRWNATVHRPTGELKSIMTMETFVFGGTASASGGGPLSRRCIARDYDKALQNCLQNDASGSMLPTTRSAWTPTYEADNGQADFLLYNSDIGASILTPEWFNVIGLFEWVRDKGTADGFEANPDKKLKDCTWGKTTTTVGLLSYTYDSCKL